MPPASNAVPGFLPSTHGLRFANRFPPGPTVRLGPLDPRWIGIGDASAGLCGGMSWFVRDWFEVGLRVPGGTDAPPNGSPLFRALVRRQVLSLDWLRAPVRFWLAGASGAARLGRVSLEEEWPRIRADIDAGRLSMVGLVRRVTISPFDLTRNHQVLAYAYDVEGSAVTLRIYDPNWPRRDDVTITLEADGATTRIRQSTGEPLAGILRLA
ncbi:MAG: hypothetical protein ACJ779_11990 [Chloroflexota bacterium]